MMFRLSDMTKFVSIVDVDSELIELQSRIEELFRDLVNEAPKTEPELRNVMTSYKRELNILMNGVRSTLGSEAEER